MFVSVVVAAGGRGSRMGADDKKQYLDLAGKPVFVHCLEVFEAMEQVREIVLVVPEGEEARARALAAETLSLEKIRISAGGETRQASVRAGLKSVDCAADIVLVHDGARPLVTASAADDAIRTAMRHGAAVAAVPVKDTIKVSRDGVRVGETLPRGMLYQIQTPQAFRRELLERAHEAAERFGVSGTDDAVLVEALGEPVALSKGDYENIKITSPEDLFIAEALLERRRSVKP